MHLPSTDKFVEVKIPEFSPAPMNETQKRLQAILDYWGPDGERHFVGGMPVTAHGECGDKRCIVRAHNRLFGDGTFAGCEIDRLCSRAAEEMDFAGVVSCSDSGFKNARKMVLRAIELAA